MPKKKFLKRIWSRYPKLGKGRKKKQGWRKPKGRDNKMREKRRGYPAVVSIGYKNEKRKEKTFVIRNINDFNKIEKTSKEDVFLLGRVGKKKKIEIIKKAKEKGIKIKNINAKKFLKKTEKKKVKENKK
jgi:large subunit ribosomal protein L32e